MAADQLDRVPNKAETCAVLHEEFTAERRARSALDVSRHLLD
jgi:hypothetical protein